MASGNVQSSMFNRALFAALLCTLLGVTIVLILLLPKLYFAFLTAHARLTLSTPALNDLHALMHAPGSVPPGEALVGELAERCSRYKRRGVWDMSRICDYARRGSKQPELVDTVGLVTAVIERSALRPKYMHHVSVVLG